MHIIILSSLRAIGEHMTSSNQYQLIFAQFVYLSCFDFRNILLWNHTNETWSLLYHNFIICFTNFLHVFMVLQIKLRVVVVVGGGDRAIVARLLRWRHRNFYEENNSQARSRTARQPGLRANMHGPKRDLNPRWHLKFSCFQGSLKLQEKVLLYAPQASFICCTISRWFFWFFRCKKYNFFLSLQWINIPKFGTFNLLKAFLPDS